MGLLDLLFGRRKQPEAPSGPPDLATQAGLDDRFLTLESPRWFGRQSRSPNGRWTISWRDADPSGNRGGHRESGRGSYLLYDNAQQRVIFRGKMERPNNGHVANSGTFVLEDWHFGSELSGTFYAIGTDGRVLLKRRLKANLLDCAVSPNGKYALCATANSPDDDGRSLFLFDLGSGQQVFAATPPRVAATFYSIDEESVHVLAHIAKLGAFRFARDGTFLDQAALDDACLLKGDYSTALMAAERALQSKPESEDDLRRILQAVLRARKEGAERDPGWRPTSLKLLGTAHDMLGNLDAAVAAYTEALALNPKIGVKRRLTALQKRRQPSGP